MLQNFRFALRQLRKAPGFTVLALATIAIGIGANTAIFSVINAVLLRPLPYFDSDRLVTILHDGDKPVAPANFVDWQKQSDVFESMGAAQAWTPNLSGGDQAESLIGMEVSHEVLPMLGVPPLLGRWFISEEDEPGKDHVVVLGHRLWMRRFGGDPGIIGQTITLRGEKYTVVGVMPSGFRFAPFWDTQAEIWRPLGLRERATSRDGNSLRIFARLKPQASLAEAQTQMATITGRLEQEYPGNQPQRYRAVAEGQSRGNSAAGAGGADGGGGVCAADCMRQRGAHADGAWRSATARDCGAVGTGGTAFADRVAVLDRERAAVVCRGRCGIGPGVLGSSRSCAAWRPTWCSGLDPSRWSGRYSRSPRRCRCSLESYLV